jgi:ClpX C4-type zinc finger
MSATCSVCGTSSDDALMVSSPGEAVYLCNRCIFSSVKLFLTGDLATAETMPTSLDAAQCYCSFCGKGKGEVKGWVGYNSNVFCCTECLGKCVEIVAERSVAKAGQIRVLAIPPHE